MLCNLCHVLTSCHRSISPLPELVVRFKGGQDYLKSVTGSHRDALDIAGFLHWVRACPNSTASAPLPPAQELILEMRMRGGAPGGAALTSADRALRVRENAQRATLGLQRLPTGLWDWLTPNPNGGTVASPNPQLGAAQSSLHGRADAQGSGAQGGGAQGGGAQT